jgi:membrane protein
LPNPFLILLALTKVHFLAAKRFARHGCNQMAAALAFYGIFSLAPLLALSIAFAGIFIEPGAVEELIDTQFYQLIGESASKQLKQVLEYVGRPSFEDSGSLLGLAALIFGATKLVAQLQFSLNVIWDVEHSEGIKGVQKFFIKKLLSFGMILVVALVLLFIFLLSTFVATLGGFLSSLNPRLPTEQFFVGIHSSFSVLFVLILFSILYKVLPDTKVRWSQTLLGAATASILFGLGKLLLGIYISQSNLGSAYGAAASLIILLLWIYYTGFVFLYGAEVAHAVDDVDFRNSSS